MLQVLILLLMMAGAAQAQAQVTPTPLGEIKREPYVAKVEPVEPPKPKPAPAPKDVEVPQATGYPNGWRWVDLPPGFRACSTNPRTGQYQCGLVGYWVAR